jgi:outer membrane protein OmpA-like peptidoglycan-associated protein
MKAKKFGMLSGVLSMALLSAVAVFAQNTSSGKLKVDVSPSEAYLFVDGNAIAPGDRTIKLSAGTHEVLIANYGYNFFHKEVTINPDETTSLDVTLDRQGDVVFGPKGRIQIEGGKLHASKDAVLLNGKTPAYFVGHVDEFNNDWIWHQELVVPPGDHMITITQNGEEVWTGTVTVGENKRVVVHLASGLVHTHDWDRGTKLASAPRFKSGIASTTVAVAPVTSAISADPVKIDCGQSSLLKWTTAEAVDVNLSHFSPVPDKGERNVSPTETTKYDLTATGPGGTSNSSATVEVNPTVNSTLTAFPTVIHYRRIGDKVLLSENVKLNWSATNSQAVSLSPFGTVEPNGVRSFLLTPSQTEFGPVNETVKYELNATNTCGGSDTETAAVQIIGSIEPIPDVLLHSVYFPTDYPTKEAPELGLVRSQQEELKTLAASFTKYLEYDPDAKISLFGYADERASNEYNQLLSERRVQRVKEYLISLGIPGIKIETSAYGEEKPIDVETVMDLQAKNPDQPSEVRARQRRATWLSYNRRVDVMLLPTNRESVRFYPNAAPDSEIMWQTKKLPGTVVEQNQ